MPFPPLRAVVRSRAARVLTAVLAAVAVVAGIIAPASPAAAETGAPTCSTWVSPWHCTTWLRGDSGDRKDGDITSWAHLGDKVEYWADPMHQKYITKIFINGNSQSCTYKSTSTGAISTANPVKVTQTDTFSFSTVGIGFSVSTSGVAGLTANASHTEFYLTTVATNSKCTSPGYGIIFVPDGLGAVYGMRHTVSTTFDWGNGKTVTVPAMDDTSLRITVL